MSSTTIGRKLYLGIGAMSLFTFLLGLAAFLGLSSVGDRVEKIVGVTVRRQTLAHSMDRDISFTMGATKGILMRGSRGDHAGVERNIQDYTDWSETLAHDLQGLQALAPEASALAAARDLQDASSAINLANSSLAKAVWDGNMTAAFLLYDSEIRGLETREKQDTARLLQMQESALQLEERAGESYVSRCRWMAGLMVLLAGCAGIALILLVRKINGALRTTVVQLADVSVEIAAAASQVAASSQSLAQSAAEQTATIEETSSASTEINSMAQRTTENSRASAEMVTHSQKGFENANGLLTEMVGAMDDINGSSQKISKIIKVIDEIAFQTNILALNAAVEAARAGEVGMGFAVVADEVRNLAQRCAQAARDTAVLIEESMQRSEGGRVKVDHVAVAIRTITSESAKIKVLVDEINLGSLEQSSGIGQISRAIHQMEQVTQRNHADAEQSAAAAEQLNAQAMAMKAAVDGLNAMVNGAGGARSGLDGQRVKAAPAFKTHWVQQV
jgi:methyl-accepting chemotaxis protein